MLAIAPLRHAPRKTPPAGLTGLDQLKAERSTLPTVTNVDYSARIQTLSRESHPQLHELLRRFEAATGCGVARPHFFQGAWRAGGLLAGRRLSRFQNTEMNFLSMGSFVIGRTAQP